VNTLAPVKYSSKKRRRRFDCRRRRPVCCYFLSPHLQLVAQLQLVEHWHSAPWPQRQPSPQEQDWTVVTSFEFVI